MPKQRVQQPKGSKSGGRKQKKPQTTFNFREQLKKEEAAEVIERPPTPPTENTLVGVLALDVIGVIADFVGTCALSLTCWDMWDALAFRFVTGLTNHHWSKLVEEVPDYTTKIRCIRWTGFDALKQQHNVPNRTRATRAVSVTTLRSLEEHLDLYNLVSLNIVFRPVLNRPYQSVHDFTQCFAGALKEMKRLSQLSVICDSCAWMVDGLQNKSELTSLRVIIDQNMDELLYAPFIIEEIGEALSTVPLPSLSDLWLDFEDNVPFAHDDEDDDEDPVHHLNMFLAGLQVVVPQLTSVHIDIGENQSEYVDDFLAALGRLFMMCSKLQVVALYCENTEMSSTSMEEIARGLRSCMGLIRLEIAAYGTKIDDDCVEELTLLIDLGPHTLQYFSLDVSDTSISATGIGELEHYAEEVEDEYIFQLSTDVQDCGSDDLDEDQLTNNYYQPNT